MQILGSNQLKQVSAGHGSSSTIMFILGLPHVVMGLIEMYNYVREWSANGCDFDENDTNYFKQDICSIIS